MVVVVFAELTALVEICVGIRVGVGVMVGETVGVGVSSVGLVEACSVDLLSSS